MIRIQTKGVVPERFYVNEKVNGRTEKVVYSFNEGNKFTLSLKNSSAQHLLKRHPSKAFVAGTIEQFKGFDLLSVNESPKEAEKVKAIVEKSKRIEITINGILRSNPQPTSKDYSYVTSGDVANLALFLAEKEVLGESNISAEGLKDIKYLKGKEVITYFSVSDYVEAETEEYELEDVEVEVEEPAVEAEEEIITKTL